MQLGGHGWKWRNTNAVCGRLNPGSSIRDQALDTATGGRGMPVAAFWHEVSHRCGWNLWLYVAVDTLELRPNNRHVYSYVILRQELNATKLSKHFHSWRWCFFVFLLHITSIKLQTHGCHFVTFSNVSPHMLPGTCCRKVIRAYQDSWDHRCRLLFCCMRNSDRNRVSKIWHTNVLACFVNKEYNEYKVAHRCFSLFC